MRTVTNIAAIALAVSAFAAGGCAQDPPPDAPTPVPPAGGTTANAYILTGAAGLGPLAFGGLPIVVYKGERLRWRNLDLVEHDVVADTTALPEFETTGRLRPGADQSFTMNTVGTTTIHCTIHPQMTGTLIVRER